MAKRKQVFKRTNQTDAIRSVRKPPMPRPAVINPKKKYDRKDKSWKNDI